MTDWDAALAAIASTVGGYLREALAEAAAARTRVYYDAEADLALAEGYYRGVGIEGLADLVRFTHTEQPRYKPSLEVYPWVDLQPDGTLRSLYTAESFQHEELIEATWGCRKHAWPC